MCGLGRTLWAERVIARRLGTAGARVKEKGDEARGGSQRGRDHS